MNKKGLSLIEVILAVGLLLVLVVLLTGSINPTALVARAHDARRKKDMGRIKVSFEDYYNDNGCYPTYDIVQTLMDNQNCGSAVFSPWLKPWPCDPEKRTSYIIVVEDNFEHNVECPSWYKIVTNLSYKSDSDIPNDWYEHDESYRVAGGKYTNQEVNYGVSSTNVNWFDRDISTICGTLCHQRTGSSGCGFVSGGFCSGACYLHPDCLEECRVDSCTN